MDPRFLRSFLCIAETGSLSRAAAMLNIVQPALSRQMRILEQELGTQLLVRHRRGVVVTEAGALLRERASAIISAIEETRQAISEAGGEPSGRVRLGLPTSMLHVMSGDVIETYARKFPRVQVYAVEAFVNVIEDHLRESRLDVAILISPKPITGIALEPLLTESVCLVGPPDCGLKMSRAVSAAGVAEVPMIMYAPGNKLRMRIEELLARTGRTLRAALEVEGQPLTFELVRRGIGYTLLPYCAVKQAVEAGQFAAAPIEGATLTWELGINRARAGAPAVKALVDLIRESVDREKRSGVWSEQDGARKRRKPKGGRD